mmetsp:Transcript_168566/g.298743  ORF Transcript_168566/g.298743 Transcript_168566/m.298743 type:complete len:87 (-) Transcript_168566:206-466(-)
MLVALHGQDCKGHMPATGRIDLAFRQAYPSRALADMVSNLLQCMESVHPKSYCIFGVPEVSNKLCEATQLKQDKDHAGPASTLTPG